MVSKEQFSENRLNTLRVMPEVNRVQLPEADVVFPQSFVTFVDQYRDRFESLASHYKNIKDLQQSMIASEELAELSDEGLTHTMNSPVGRRMQFNEARNNQVNSLRNNIISLVLNKEGKKTEDLALPKNEFEKQRYNWMIRVNNYAFSYQEKVEPLEEMFTEAKEHLVEEFQTYLQSNDTNLELFADFLRNDDFREEREKLKVFLSVLEKSERNVQRIAKGNTESILETAKESVIARLIEVPTEECVADFITTKLRDVHERDDAREKTKGSQKPGFNLISHIEFTRAWASKYSSDREVKALSEMPIEQIIEEELPGYSNWPEALRKEYQQYVSNIYSDIIMQIRQNLFPYRNIEADKVRGIELEKLFTKTGRKREKHESIETEEPKDTVEIEDTIKPSYHLATIRRLGNSQHEIEAVDKEQSEEIVVKLAGKYAKNEITRKILLEVIDELVENPLRPGVLQTIREAPTRNGTFPIWSFAMKRHSQIGVSTAIPAGLRIVYLMDDHDQEDQKFVLLGIGDHNWYERLLCQFPKKN